MTSSLSRSDSYQVDYLGTAMLPHSATGLGALQKPLRELYFKHRKPGSGSRLQERQISLARDAMLIKYSSGTGKGVLTEEAYPVPNVVYWDAVRFVAVKAKDKKLRGAFEPLDNDHSRCQDNLFVVLDKKVGFLAQMSHPALFVCVLRRVVGVRALDLHAFVCGNERDALAIVHALRTLQAEYEHAEAHHHGVFGYSPFNHGDGGTEDAMPIVAQSQRQPPVAASVRSRQMRPSSQPAHDKGRAPFFKLTQGDFDSTPTQHHYQHDEDEDETYQRVLPKSEHSRTRPPPGGQPTAFTPALAGLVTPSHVCAHQYSQTNYSEAHAAPPSRAQSMSQPSRYEMGASLAKRMHPRSGSPSYERTIPRNDDRRRSAADHDDRFTAPTSLPERCDRMPLEPRRIPLEPRRIPLEPRQPPSTHSHGSNAFRPTSSGSHTRPVALVQPHKIQGVRVLPNAAMVSLKKSGADRKTTSPLQTDVSKTPQAVAQRHDKSDHVILNLRECKHSVKKTSSPDNWQNKSSRPTVIGSPSGNHQSKRTTEEEKSNGRLLTTAKKDAEIASVVHNMHFDCTLSPSGASNFEKSLGYFP